MRRKLILAAVALLVLVFAGLALAYVMVTDTPDAGLDTELRGVSVSTSAALDPATTTEPATTTGGQQAPKRPAEDCWLTYGGDPQRTFYRGDLDLGPPRRKPVWVRPMGDLIELPPVICDGRIYVNLELGTHVALDSETGRRLWTWKAGGRLIASPNIAGPRIVIASKDGTVTALNRANGKPLWQISTSGPVESSPVTMGNTVYFGSWDGRLFAVDVRTGRIRWAYDTGGEIKGSASIWGDRICVANYGGGVFCLRRTNGALVWRTYVKRDALRYESFYATPSTDGKRLYAVARTGKVLALNAATGSVLWTEHMGNLAYGTPAIADGRVIAGAFDGVVRAFRARDGRQLWSTGLQGRIIAPAVVVGDLVYVSTQARKTYALRLGDGKVVWRFNAGNYSPGIATDRRYYFSLNGLLIAWRGRHR